MPGLNLFGMGRIARAYQPSLHRPAIPALADCEDWDQRNAALIQRSARAAGPQSPALLELSHFLADADRGRSPVPSMASNVDRRWVVDHVGGHVWKVVDRLYRPAQFFTAIPRYGEIAEVDLRTFNPRLINGRFRTELNANGALGSTGILFAVLEAEHQIRSDRWRFHWHGVASGEKIAALDALRDTPAFRGARRKPGEPKSDVTVRLQISRRPLYNLPDPLTYCIKPWSARWLRDDGSRGGRLRLPDHALLSALLWQHQWSLLDTSLVMGMRPGRGGFIVLPPTRMRGGEA